ncbi:MAG: hypothetical protein KA004_16605 [Verrucomicrobiales bacterium]|nr:hypothetical protein [Verrucomicrobiales bacterium]
MYEFNELFETVYDNLKLRNAVSGGEEMLRLRAYEKLQNLVSRGLVEKISGTKTYRGLENIKSAKAPKPVALPVAASAAAKASTAKTATAKVTASKGK